MPVTLVLGGARSGKSRYAESKVVAEQENGRFARRHYVATAIPFDDEMKARIQHHQQQRDSEWIEHEQSEKLAQLLESFNDKDIILVDCLTVWLNNIIYNNGITISEASLKENIDQLVKTLANTEAMIVLVSNEVGLGVIPMGKETRMFVDHAGWMNQKIAAVADHVVLVTAGLPLALKGNV